MLTLPAATAAVGFRPADRRFPTFPTFPHRQNGPAPGTNHADFFASGRKPAPWRAAAAAVRPFSPNLVTIFRPRKSRFCPKSDPVNRRLAATAAGATPLEHQETLWSAVGKVQTLGTCNSQKARADQFPPVILDKTPSRVTHAHTQQTPTKPKKRQGGWRLFSKSFQKLLV